MFLRARDRAAFALLAMLIVALAVAPVTDAHPRRARHHHRHHHRRHHHRPRASRSPAPITWGSSLTGAPTQTIFGRFAQDAEFWLTGLGSPAVPGVDPVVTAPVSGLIKFVRLKVGDDSADVPIRFSVVKPLGGGQTEVLTTSTPHLILPAHSPGIHTFDFSQLEFGMPINEGDYLTLDTPGVDPSAMFWYALAPGSTTALYTGHGPTQSPAFVRTQTPEPGLELLMQVVEQPGGSYHFHLPPAP